MQEYLRRWIVEKYEDFRKNEKHEEEYKYAHLIIKDDSRWKFYWDLYCIGLVIEVAVVAPYRLAFDMEDSVGLRAFGIVMDVSFLIDLIFTFC